jgi:hypothetical protein
MKPIPKKGRIMGLVKDTVKGIRTAAFTGKQVALITLGAAIAIGAAVTIKEKFFPGEGEAACAEVPENCDLETTIEP